MKQRRIFLLPLLCAVLFFFVTTRISSKLIQTAVRAAQGQKKESSDLPPPNWMPDTRLLEALQRVQNPPDCNNRKFLVYSFAKLNGATSRGFGATLTSLWRWVILALEDNRTVVIDSINWDMADCPNNSRAEGGLACYFLPFSSCDMTHVLAAAPISSHVIASSDNSSIARAAFRHRVATVQVFSPILRENVTIEKSMTFHGSDCQLMLAVMTYFFRFNIPTWQMISRSIRASLPTDFNSSKAISMPIRASDKCLGHRLQDGSSTGEMRCYRFDDFYMKLAEELRGKNADLDTIILTSEDPECWWYCSSSHCDTGQGITFS